MALITYFKMLFTPFHSDENAMTGTHAIDEAVGRDFRNDLYANSSNNQQSVKY